MARAPARHWANPHDLRRFHLQYLIALGTGPVQSAGRYELVGPPALERSIVNIHISRPSWGASHHMTDRVVMTLERFLHIEAVSGGVLIFAALVALLLANSPLADSYHALWQLRLTLGIGNTNFSQSLHFVVNDALMTVFFLVAGMEIRRELHEGALSNARLATLPLVAATGGVVMPAIIYLCINPQIDVRQGWAVPIATDIAFALGVLALLGGAIPRGVRVLLLALAIIDDIIAVTVIALFYSHQLHAEGALLAALAIVIVLLFQRFGLRSALAYVLPGALLWFGLLRLGVHPTLAGIVLGLMTPVVALNDRSGVSLYARKLLNILWRVREQRADSRELVDSLRAVDNAKLDMIPPVVRVEAQLHPWVAYGVMPLFAFANAGVTIHGAGDFAASGSMAVAAGIGVGLLLGKPLGILLASFLAIRARWCELPEDVGWRGLSLIALLGGIGFTMAIFIAMLAFESATLLASAKLAILLASAAAAAAAVILGRLLFKPSRQAV